MSCPGAGTWFGVCRSHNQVGVSGGLQDRSGTPITLFMLASPATFAAVEYRLPISSPFLAPRKGKSAGLADFGRF